MTDSLCETPKRDDFQTESPIRAFTSWEVKGVYAMGKGFRPSLAHIVAYLNAMEEKEGWQLVQILEPASQSPSFVFRQWPPKSPLMDSLEVTSERPIRKAPELGMPYNVIKVTQSYPYLCPVHPDKIATGLRQVARDMMKDEMDALANGDFVDRIRGYAAEIAPDITDKHCGFAEAGDDPINPSHYKNKPGSTGRECADIGERLSANGYQILKYCWRLGKKDDRCQELGKALWYGQSEMTFLVTQEAVGYADMHHKPFVADLVHPDIYMEERIADQPIFTQNIARMLWSGYNRRKLRCIMETIQDHSFHLDCGRGLAI